ncbi:ABC transporter ATP-binding protein [Asticcacaulis sp. 201]|uniref:ABC transporter ATP-binding protein n=1 Tax=Asticcacaulis sp. 201 TaxID=3028787 RepID=UPI002916ACA3|nr:ABC transporter ATP-binding protein [Asticcacaulis sp. 201]MDV6332930.1 ABC transporter ATP-binding protein [Asticcacaulis sp. 201]
MHAIKGVTLAIDQGEFVAIIGPSGSGKSTLLNIIGTLEAPTGGVYRLGGQEVAALRDRDLSRLRATQIGFVFQNFNLIDHLSVFENVKLGLRFRHDGLVNTRERVIAAMDKVGIAHRADHLPRHLSGGQQQRCAIARAIVGNPALVLADEPTGNLDSKSANQIINILEDLNRHGTTVIIVTHAMGQADRASRIVEMHDGAVHLSSRRLP